MMRKSYVMALGLGLIGAAVPPVAMGSSSPAAIQVAILGFLEDHGARPSPDHMRRLSSFDALPESIQIALSAVVQNFAALEERSAPGSIGTPAFHEGRFGLLKAVAMLEEAVRSPTTLDDLLPLVSSMSEATQPVLALPALIGLAGSASLPPPPPCDSHPFNYSFAPIINIQLEDVDNLQTEDFILSIDACGNDVYHNNAGGSSVFGPCGLGGDVAAALIDLNGNDEYGNALNLRSCGANGGGHRGSGFLYDANGNDKYVAFQEGVNGGASATGSGFLVDLQGNDRYEANSSGVNGGGVFGSAGFLFDASGNDRYFGESGGVNGGSSHFGAGHARGTLIDLAGNDRYVARAGGANGAAVIGVGLLFDGSGADWYEDLNGGTGNDVTVVPKGVVGAQIDN